MWYPATITTAAEAEPVSIDDAKAHCRVDADDDDSNTVLNALIAAARDHVERYCAVRFAPQSVSVRCDHFSDFCRLPEAPVASIDSISYVDPAGNVQTLDPAVYEERFDGLETEIALQYGQQWPSLQPRSRITVNATVGYVVAPAAVKHAMLLLIGTWFEHRETIASGTNLSDLPVTVSVDSLLSNYRRGP